MSPDEIYQLTEREIQQLKHGQELMNEEKERMQNRSTTPSADQRRREQEALEKFA